MTFQTIRRAGISCRTVILVIGCAVLGSSCTDEATALAEADGADAEDTSAGVDADVHAGVDTWDGTGPGPDVRADCGSRAECAALWEESASARFQTVLTDADALAAFLEKVPKGGDLHNHLNGAVYAETYLEWARADENCIDTESFSLLFGNKCTSETEPIPASGPLFDQIVRAWSMKDFVPGAESGHDHFFATFGKYGLVAGAHRDESIADVLSRAAAENVVYVETMFNLGKNMGAVAASAWSGPLAAEDLPAIYDAIMADPDFASALDDDVSVVEYAATGYRDVLGCDDIASAPACDVGVRFIAQVARTGPADTVFGQLVSAYEMAVRTPWIVAANLSSPEDDPKSLNAYDLHMAMLDFLHGKYTQSGLSPLHITLHAGELTPEYLPAEHAAANTFHIRKAVEIGHAERIGHGLDVMSETDPEGLLATLKEKNVLVEVCLSSNLQILEISGPAHPLRAYLDHQVPVALATDDQGISRSSMAGEYTRAALDQKLSYRELKTMARDSLEHAFLPGASLWTSVAEGRPIAACAPTETLAVGDPPEGDCESFLAQSERARTQWELERRFLVFESGQ